jgi:hypothetical protein
MRQQARVQLTTVNNFCKWSSSISKYANLGRRSMIRRPKGTPGVGGISFTVHPLVVARPRQGLGPPLVKHGGGRRLHSRLRTLLACPCVRRASAGRVAALGFRRRASKSLSPRNGAPRAPADAERNGWHVVGAPGRRSKVLLVNGSSLSSSARRSSLPGVRTGRSLCFCCSSPCPRSRTQGPSLTVADVDANLSPVGAP